MLVILGLFFTVAFIDNYRQMWPKVDLLLYLLRRLFSYRIMYRGMLTWQWLQSLHLLASVEVNSKQHSLSCYQNPDKPGLWEKNFWPIRLENSARHDTTRHYINLVLTRAYFWEKILMFKWLTKQWLQIIPVYIHTSYSVRCLFYLQYKSKSKTYDELTNKLDC